LADLFVLQDAEGLAGEGALFHPLSVAFGIQWIPYLFPGVEDVLEFGEET